MFDQICNLNLSIFKLVIYYQIRQKNIQMNSINSTSKFSQENRKYMKPPLPSIANNKHNLLLQSKQINLISQKSISTSLQKETILTQKKSSMNQKLHNFLLKQDVQTNKKKVTDYQQKSEFSKSKSRISTSYSQQSLNSFDKKNLKEQLFKQKTPDNILKQKITSKSWIIFDNESKKVLLEKGSHIKRQMASLTKIMTCITAIEFCQRWAINMKQLKIKITKRINLVDGTTANLQIGHVLTLESLLYGMMLPSGNDAAITIAQYIGTLVNLIKQGFSKQYIYDSEKLSEEVASNRFCMKNFLLQMNLKSLDLGMLRTHYANSHGLSQKNNYSTCEDLVKLCQYCIKNRRFMQIVSCKSYKTKCLSTETEYNWQNTHKLLGEGWQGIKTGVTPAAGPCLSSFYKGYKNNKHVNLIIILLNCNTMDQRYQETKLLFDYGCQKKNPMN